MAIVRAMLADSDLILMDEPFSGLDAENKEKALAFIKEEQKGRSVIFALHLAKGYCLGFGDSSLSLPARNSARETFKKIARILLSKITCNIIGMCMNKKC